MGFFDFLTGGGDSRVESIKPPEWYEDPDYRFGQDKLKELGGGLLEGKVPSFYQGIGETGGAEFEKFLGLTNRDILQGVNETAGRNGRGGNAAAISAQAIADNSTKARYADYTRALQGKQDLLNLGVGVTSGVRGAGQTQGQNKNDFNVGNYKQEVANAKYLDKYDQEQSSQLGETLGTIAGGGIGFMVGGPAGAMAGAGLGSSLMGGSGGGSWMDAFMPKAGSKTTSSPGVSSYGSIGNGSNQGFQDVLKNMFGY